LKYVEVALGSVNNRNHFIEVADLPLYVKKARSSKEDLYISYYSYDSEIKEHFKIRKTVSSFKGNFYLDQIIFDIDKMGKKSDSAEESEKKDIMVLDRARYFYERLKDDWKLDEDTIKIWYSGNGYHFTIPDIFHFEPSNYLPKEVKATLNKYFPEMDTMPLMPTGLIRVAYTVNYKSNRYKVPLTSDELFGLSHKEIIAISEKGEYRKFKKKETKCTLDYRHLIVRDEVERSKVSDKNDPTRIVTCNQKMFNEGAVEGSRHLNLVRLVSTWRMQGLDLNAIKVLALHWNNGQLSNYEINKQVDYIFEKGYTFSCSDTVRVNYCDPKCVYYKNKDYILQAADSEKLEADLVKYIRSDFRKNAFNLQDIYPLPKEYWVYPGEMITILGASKVGKSAFIQNICTKLKNLRILYINFEFTPLLFYRRLIQIEHGMTKDEIYNYYKEKTNSLSQALSHIKVMQVAPDIEQFPKLINDLNPNMVVVDTFDELEVKGIREYNTKSEELAKKLKRLAEQMNIITLGIHHIPKSQCYDDKGRPKKLTLQSARGSSAVAQKSDKIIAVEGDLSNQIRTIDSLAARDESPFLLTMNLDFDTFRMEAM